MIAFFFRGFRDGSGNIIGFDSMFFVESNIQCLHQFAGNGELGNKLLWGRFAIGFIGGELLFAESMTVFIKRHEDGVSRFHFLQEFHKHVGESENRVSGDTTFRAHDGGRIPHISRIKGAEQQRVSVDDIKML